MSDRCATELVYAAPGKALTATDIQRALGIKDGISTIRVVASWAIPGSVPEGAIVVIDLSDSYRAPATPPPSPKCLAGRDVILVLQEQGSILATWLGVVRHPSVHVMRVPSTTHKVHPQLAMVLRSRVTGIRHKLASAVVAQDETLFAEARDLVRAILDDPWGIRTPQDLASALRLSIAEIRSHISHRVSRPEHFITLVRWLAFEHLIAVLGVKPARALFLVGMRDRSNLRRQFRRAQYLLAAHRSASGIGD